MSRLPFYFILNVQSDVKKFAFKFMGAWNAVDPFWVGL